MFVFAFSRHTSVSFWLFILSLFPWQYQEFLVSKDNKDNFQLTKHNAIV